jgi:hypothetical protein
MRMVEWEKTVNHTPECELSNTKINFGRCTCGMEKQAELSYESRDREVIDSFNKGYRQCGLDTKATEDGFRKLHQLAGMIKVVDWVNSHGCIERRDPVWQAFLKENGIDGQATY